MAAQLPYMSRQCPHRVDLILPEARGPEVLAFARADTTPGFFGYWARVQATVYSVPAVGVIQANRTMHYEYRFSDPNVALEVKFKFG